MYSINSVILHTKYPSYFIRHLILASSSDVIILARKEKTPGVMKTKQYQLKRKSDELYKYFYACR